jgi:hypothetical protein
MAVDRNIIGRKSPEFVCTVEPGKIKEFAAAIGETNELFWSDDDTTLLAPPTFSHIFRSGKMELLMSDCGLDATKFLHGEHEIDFHRALRPGDRLTYSIEVIDVRYSEGRRSGPIDIIVLQTLVKNLAGQKVQTIKQTFVAKR